jgi:predicted SAM-dependent methyltransferase
MKLPFVNLACGGTFNKDWVNVDIAPTSDEVIKVDLKERLPWDDDTFKFAYHSHFIEHLGYRQAREFMKECYRIVSPGAIIRVATPNLEVIANCYLTSLHGALQGDPGATARYRWTVIELLDQFSRQVSGGLMLEYWMQNPMPDEEFVLQRMGNGAKQFVHRFRSDSAFAEAVAKSRDPQANPVDPGELHRWLYDRFSLFELLRDAGFTRVGVCSATESGLTGYSNFLLDTLEDGSIRKPDSLFMEGIKAVKQSAR